MTGDDWSVPNTNNGEGMNMAKWVGIWEEWMNRMLANGFQVNDLPGIAAAHGETFPKSLLATAVSKNTLFPAANMLYEYDLDNKMKRSYPHNNADYPNGTGYGEWVPMDAAEIKNANDYYGWRENPKNYDWIDNKFGGNAYNAYLAAGNGYKLQGGLSGAKVNNGGVKSTAAGGTGTGTTGGIAGSFYSQPVMDELARNMRLDTAAQQFNLDKAIREYTEGRPIQNYLTDIYGQVMGVGFDRPPVSLSGYAGSLNPSSILPVGTPNPNGGNFGQDPNFPNVPNNPYDPITNPGGVTPYPGVNTNPNGDGGTGGPGPNTGQDQQGGGNSQNLWPNGGGGSENDDVHNLSAGVQSFSGGSGQVIIPYDPNADYSMPWSDNPLNPYSPNYTGSVSANNVSNPGTYAPGTNTVPGGEPTGQPGGTTAPGTTGSSTLPFVTIPDANYHQLSNSFDPNNPTTWGLLAAPAAQQAGQLDAQRAQILRGMPAGGERNLALAQATNQTYANVGGLKQALMGQALTGLGNISQSKITGQAIPNSGAAQSLLNNSTQQQGNAQQYDLGLKQIDASKQGQKSSMWGSILGAIGGVAAGALLSDIATKTDVKPFKRGLTDLRKVDAFEYTYNDEAGESRGLRGISVMAQDLERAIPEAVLPGSHKTIVPMGLLMTAVNAVKELDKKVKKLEKERK